MAEFEENYLMAPVQTDDIIMDSESAGARVKRSPEPKSYGKGCKNKAPSGCEQCVGCHVCCNGKTCIKAGGGCHPPKGKYKKEKKHKKMKKH